jgi:hypothetical protein
LPGRRCEASLPNGIGRAKANATASASTFSPQTRAIEAGVFHLFSGYRGVESSMKLAKVIGPQIGQKQAANRRWLRRCVGGPESGPWRSATGARRMAGLF